MPNVSANRPDYLFRTVTGVWGGHSNSSRETKDLQDGILENKNVGYKVCLYAR